MKIKKFVAGLSAAVLAATMMSVSVSAAKLGDVVFSFLLYFCPQFVPRKECGGQKTVPRERDTAIKEFFV